MLLGLYFRLLPSIVFCLWAIQLIITIPKNTLIISFVASYNAPNFLNNVLLKVYNSSNNFCKF